MKLLSHKNLLRNFASTSSIFNSGVSSSPANNEQLLLPSTTVTNSQEDLSNQVAPEQEKPTFLGLLFHHPVVLGMLANFILLAHFARSDGSRSASRTLKNLSSKSAGVNALANHSVRAGDSLTNNKPLSLPVSSSALQGLTSVAQPEQIKEAPAPASPEVAEPVEPVAKFEPTESPIESPIVSPIPFALAELFERNSLIRDYADSLIERSAPRLGRKTRNAVKHKFPRTLIIDKNRARRGLLVVDPARDLKEWQNLRVAGEHTQNQKEYLDSFLRRYPELKHFVLQLETISSSQDSSLLATVNSYAKFFNLRNPERQAAWLEVKHSFENAPEADWKLLYETFGKEAFQSGKIPLSGVVLDLLVQRIKHNNLSSEAIKELEWLFGEIECPQFQDSENLEAGGIVSNVLVLSRLIAEGHLSDSLIAQIRKNYPSLKAKITFGLKNRNRTAYRRILDAIASNSSFNPSIQLANICQLHNDSKLSPELLSLFCDIESWHFVQNPHSKKVKLSVGEQHLVITKTDNRKIEVKIFKGVYRSNPSVSQYSVDLNNGEVSSSVSQGFLPEYFQETLGVILNSSEDRTNSVIRFFPEEMNSESELLVDPLDRDSSEASFGFSTGVHIFSHLPAIEDFNIQLTAARILNLFSSMPTGGKTNTVNPPVEAPGEQAA